MSGYQVTNVGAQSTWIDNIGGFSEATLRPGRVVVDRELTNQYVGLTVNALEPGTGATYWHSHSEIEEVYVFLGGKGQMGLDNDVIDVEAGTIVRVGQGVLRTWRAKPESEGQLQWLCIRAGGTELPEFPNDALIDREKPLPW